MPAVAPHLTMYFARVSAKPFAAASLNTRSVMSSWAPAPASVAKRLSKTSWPRIPAPRAGDVQVPAAFTKVNQPAP